MDGIARFLYDIKFITSCKLFILASVRRCVSRGNSKGDGDVSTRSLLPPPDDQCEINYA